MTNNIMTSNDPIFYTESGQERNPMLSAETLRLASGSPTASQPSMEYGWSSSKAANPPNPPLPMRESLGRRGLIGVVGGSLWILGIFGFLAFLWCGQGSKPDAADATRLWRFIALHNYFPQTITLCALALRVAVSLQAVICTSMIAAIVLEKRGARRTEVAWFSVMRSINNGPRKLGTLLMSDRRMTILKRAETWLTLVIIIVTSALQFSSTLLLSDMSDFIIVGDLNTTQLGDVIMYDKHDFRVEDLGLQFTTQPPVYAVLSEVQAGFNATPNTYGLSDTGLIQRSLLPIPGSDARSSVRKFEGTSLVMTSQSSCIRPQISATYSADIYDIGEQDAFGYMVGTVDYGRSFGMAGVRPGSICANTGCEDVAFECPIPSSSAEWATITCVIDGTVRGTTYDPTWNSEDGVWSLNSSVVLVITTNTNYTYWRGVSDANTLPSGTPYEEWQSYELSSGQLVNISLCSSGFNVNRFDTSMSTAGPLHEPRTDLVLTSKTYSTTDVQNSFGVNEPQRSHLDRKILDLKILGPPASDSRPSPASQPAFFGPLGGNTTVGRLTAAIIELVMYDQIQPGFQPNISLSLCYFCTTNGYSINPEISLLFNDITTKTGRAANALLTLTTIVFSSVYYTYLSTLRVSHDTRIVAVTTVRVPGPCSANGCVGFSSVSALLFAHVLCVVGITFLYVQQVRYSRHGNIWHAISQLTGDGLTNVLDEAQNATDKEVEHILDEEYSHCQVKLGRRGENGPVEVFDV
ncbi:hypothetical protein F5Y03DRAFT_378184 [Xylaria venustula]|nr:hypothetical protein F5Y03DRAFT_378184 [Xylaria venustula]